MRSYIFKDSSIKKSDIFSKNSFSPFSYRKVYCPNKNTKTINSLLTSNKKGFEPGSDSYINFTENHFVRIGELSDNNFIFQIKDSTLKIIPPDKEKNTIINGDICYQTASNVGNVCIFKGRKAYFNSHIRKLDFKENRFYIFSILKSNFGKNQVEVGGSIKGVDNFNNDLLLNTIIPFPTTKNHKSPELIEKYVSLLTQNIIDKEEQIEIRQKNIDELVYTELRNNQKSNFSYSLPKKSDLLSHKRIDTGLYTEKYKEENHLIENYKNGFSSINTSKFKSGSTPKTRIFNASKSSLKWVTPTNISDEGFYNPIEKISMPTSNNLKKDCILFINRTSKGKKGEYVGITCFYDVSYYGEGQHNQGLYRIEHLSKDEMIFTTAFMNSRIMRKICGNISIGSKMKEMKSYDFATLKFPKFDKSLKQKIGKLYYNNIDKTNFDFDNYLENEKVRNQELGIFQLNTEIIEIKKELEIILNKIITEETIKLNANA